MTYGLFATGVEDYGATPLWAGSTPFPVVAVEVAFTTNPGATPVWVNIGDRVKGFTVHRGRADELSAFNAGQATITLNNEDRAFDPTYSGSPYWPNVVPMRRIRVRATYAAATYDVFNGYVTNWQQQYSPPQDAEAVVECSDAFKVLGNITLLSSVWAQEIAADNPVVWFRLDEPSGSTSVIDRVGGRSATLGTAVLGQPGLVARDSGTAVQSTSISTIDTGPGPVIATGYPLSVSAIVKTASNMSIIVELLDAGASVTTMFLSVDSVTQQAGVMVQTVTSSQLYRGGPVINDNNPHLVTATWDAAGTVRLYTDGVLVAGPVSFTGAFIVAPSRIRIGYTTAIPLTIDEVAVFASELPASRVAVHAAARSTARVGELTGARTGWVLDTTGWPAADRLIDTGTSTLQGADGNQTALAALQAVEQTEFGALFVTAGGLVRFIARDSLLKAPYLAAQAVFGDSGTELEFGDLTYEYDDRLIYNEAQVSRSNGTVQTVKDTASQTKYLRRTKVVSGLLSQSDRTSLDAANWLVNHYKDPLLRVTGLRLEPSAGNDATHFPQVLGRELMDRVTINRRPQNLGAAISQDAQIQGITHQVNMKQGWVTRWDLAPAETQAYWVAGVAGSSEAGQTTRAGF